MIDPLSRLAILHGTDKFGYHDYTPHYFGILAPLRDKPVRMLEIGVGGYGFEDRGGESLATWRDFFPEGQITGLDIQRKTMDLGPRVHIVQGSQVDADCLARVVAERGPFDLILDDGSHRNEHVVESFALLFPTLKPGGIYLVEDAQTAFFPRFGGSLTLDAPNSIGMAAQMMRDLAQGQGGEIVEIERFHNIFVLHKRDPDASLPLAREDRRIRAARAGRGGLVEITAADLPDIAALTAVIETRFPDKEKGGALLIGGGVMDPALLTEIFIQIDHTEIRVHHPEAELAEVARRILGMAIYADGVVLEIGDNDYPSNFAYDPAHPRAAAAIAAIGEVLSDPAASATGLMQYATMISRLNGAPAAFPLIDRLAALGCRNEQFFVLAGRRLKLAEDWMGLERLAREGLEVLPGNPHVTPLLSVALRKTGRAAEALQTVREVHERNPRERAIVSLLAQLELAAGHADRAILLLEKSMTLFPLAQRPERLRRLIDICRSAGDHAAAVRAADRLLKIVPDDPVATEVLNSAASP
jgi:tetratricopeptide (TPR) repeat protein